MNAVCVSTISSLAEDTKSTRSTPEKAVVSVSGRDLSPSVISILGSPANGRASAWVRTSALTGRLFRTNSRITADPATPLPAATSTVAFLIAYSLLPHVSQLVESHWRTARSSELDGDESGALWFILQHPGSAGFDAYESVPYIGRHNIRRREDMTSSVGRARRRTEATRLHILLALLLSRTQSTRACVTRRSGTS